MSRKKREKTCNKKIRLIVLLCILAVAVLFCAYVIWDNYSVGVEEYTYTNEKIPESFNGVRLLHISDWENKEYGNEKYRNYFVNKCKSAEPDYIFITGDMISGDNHATDEVVKMISSLSNIAPVYYTYGNHEMDLSEEKFGEYEKELKLQGVTVLDGENCKIKRQGETINIAGFHELSWFTKEYGVLATYGYGEPEMYYENQWENSLKDLDDDFTILLTHRCECFNVYQNYKADLIFAGHAHGGIVRFFGTALFAPEQGYFPKYFSGEYRANGRTMYVSRGLGMKKPLFRVFNRASLNLVVLSKN